MNAIYDCSSTAIFLDQLGHAWREFGPNGTLPKQAGIWSNEEYFGLGARLQNTVDVAERRKILRRMLTIVDRDDPPVHHAARLRPVLRQAHATCRGSGADARSRFRAAQRSVRAEAERMARRKSAQRRSRAGPRAPGRRASSRS